MCKQKKIKNFVFILIAVILVGVISSFLLGQDEKETVYNISYISDTNKSEDIRVIIEGINQAAKDMKVEVKIYTLSNGDRVESQIELIEQECKGKSDAIIISPIDSNKLSDAIKKVNKDIPIIFMNSTVNNLSDIPIVSCDNKAIGKEIAGEIIRNGNTRKNIGIVINNKNKSSIKDMYEGFISEIDYSKNTCKEFYLDNSVNEKISEFIEAENIDILVSFEREILENMAQLKKENKLSIELYGVGRTNKILSYLEEDIINGIVVQNEFNLGYLGVKIAVDKIKKEKFNNDRIDFAIINENNMYWDENQKILFPFVK